MHPRWVENAVREKPGMAGACDKLAGASFARDKPAGAFVVSSKMLVGLVKYRESGRRPELRTDVRRDGQIGKINNQRPVRLLYANPLFRIDTCRYLLSISSTKHPQWHQLPLPLWMCVGFHDEYPCI
jgi:hypothetical protein